MRASYLNLREKSLVYKASWYGVEILCDTFGRIEVHGYENVPAEPCIIVANHVSFLDPVAVGFFREAELCAIARDTLMSNKLLAAYFKAVNAIAVKRGHSGNLGAFREVLSRVKRGYGVIVFPEGTRSPDGNLLEGKPGAGLLAIKAGIPILPVRSFGFEKVLPRSNKLGGGVRLALCSGKTIMPEEIDPGKSHPNRAQVIVDAVMEKIAQIQLPRLEEI